MQKLLVLALVLAAPAAWATPTSWHWDDERIETVYRGVATQGSADLSHDWPGVSDTCTTSIIHAWTELRILAGSEDDILTLEIPEAHTPPAGSPVATRGAPAFLYADQGDGCEDFIVHGTQVAGEVEYEVRVSTFGLLCVPVPCVPHGALNTVERAAS